nr:high molecular mass early light-inducible protein HV58, chloroplastic-like [Aegilops tauschii subsp. strangulata]
MTYVAPLKIVLDSGELRKSRNMEPHAARGGGLLDQAGSGAGLGWFLVTAGVFSVASLVPLLQGQSVESKSSGFWSADAELWNGRFAMLGLVALAATEFITGAPFVNI